MIKKLHISIVSILMIGLMFSCATSNDVASNRGIQKRKYNKGFYVEKGPKLGGDSKRFEQVENENTLDENTVAIEEPTERKSSEPEVVFVTEETAENSAFETEIEPEVEPGVETEEVPKVSTKKSENVTNLETVVQEKTRMPTKLKNSVKKVIDRTKSLTPQDMTRGGSTSLLVLVLLVIIALILPPLAVILYDGVGRPFWIDLVLWLIGIGVGFALFGPLGAYLCALIALIYALLVIFDMV